MMTQNNNRLACVGPNVDAIIGATWGSSVIDQHRFADDASRVLARYEDVGPEGILFPDYDELLEMGINVELLVTVLDCGAMVGSDFGTLFKQYLASEISLDDLDDALDCALNPEKAAAGLSQEDLETAIAHIPDVMEAARCHPHDHFDRAMHSQGLCSCHVEFVS